MRTEDEIIGRLLIFADRDPRVKIVLLNGSRVNPNAVRDELRDYDVIFGVTEIAPYADDTSWIATFGELMILQHNKVEENGEQWDIFLMLFEDGIRIDLSFRQAERLVEPDDSLTKVLLDKDGLMGEVPPPDDSSYVTRRPSERQVDAALNEIWWCSPNVAKGLLRNELPYAKYMLDVVIRDALVQLLGWYVGMNRDWSVNVGKAGRWLEKFLPEEIWSTYVRTYADADPERIWDALFAVGEVARSAGAAVADRLGCAYPREEDRKVTAYMRRLREKEPGRGTESR